MPPLPDTYTFAELCTALGKGTFYVRNLQKHLGIPVLHGKDGGKRTRAGRKKRGQDGSYPPPYLIFLEKVVAMRAFNVPLAKIGDLFEIEKKILTLLHFDSLYLHDAWYFGSAEPQELSERHLLLTGHDLGFPIVDGDIQHNLDFAERDAELFHGEEMGEDVRRVLTKYRGMVDEVRTTIRKEQPVLRNALDWAEALWGIR